ncbi:hypothetical protein [Actinomadura sp. 6K520]|uniref:hypothetical protein n=1 Tax=Actinomadura sp. 6K520 TaxID=2530364 RepID=UPI0014055338|nr:hypothetical protein [Actinomadura sp. 6K520]
MPPSWPPATWSASWNGPACAPCTGTSSTPEQALALLLRSYIELTVTSSHLTGALITEVVHLPDEQRHAIRRLQHDYVGEWGQLLTTRRPGLTEPEARVITQAVLAIVNDLSRIGHLRRRPPAERRPRSLGPGRPGGTAAIGRFLSRRHGARVADHALERARDDFDSGSSCSPPADTEKKGTP